MSWNHLGRVGSRTGIQSLLLQISYRIFALLPALCIRSDREGLRAFNPTNTIYLSKRQPNFQQT